MDEINFDALRAEIDRKQANLADSERRLVAVTATGRSVDGLAEVTVSATGAVTSVWLAPETFRRSTPEYLGRSVAEAAQQATRQVRQSARVAVAPIAAVGKEVADAIQEPWAPQSQTAHVQTTGGGAEASSTDRSAQVGVDVLGIIAVVRISPDAYRGGSTTRLAAAITEAAERAARQMFETRMGAVESAVGAEAPNMDEFFPIPVTPESVNPVAPPVPQAYVPPSVPATPSASAVAQWNPRSGRPGDTVVGPSDWDDDMGDYGGGQRRSWTV